MLECSGGFPLRPESPVCHQGPPDPLRSLASPDSLVRSVLPAHTPEMCIAGLGEGRMLGVGNPDSTKRSLKIGVRTAIITWVSVKLESVETFTGKGRFRISVLQRKRWCRTDVHTVHLLFSYVRIILEGRVVRFCSKHLLELETGFQSLLQKKCLPLLLLLG